MPDDLIRELAVAGTRAVTGSLKAIIPHALLVQANDTIYGCIEGALRVYEEQRPRRLPTTSEN